MKKHFTTVMLVLIAGLFINAPHLLAQTDETQTVCAGWNVYNGTASLRYGNPIYPTTLGAPSSFTSGNDLWVNWGAGNYSGQVTKFYNSAYYGTVFVTINDPALYSMSGSNYLCNSQGGYFSVSQQCVASVTWTAPSGWSVNGGGNSATVSATSAVLITAPSSGGGLSTISASSGSLYITKDVWVGAPDYVQINGPNTVSSGGSDYFELSPYGGHPSFTQQGVYTSADWSFPYGTGPGFSCNNCNSIGTWMSMTTSTMAMARVQNGCGYSEWAYKQISVQQTNCPPEGCPEDWSYYPNPASNELIINFPTLSNLPIQSKSGAIPLNPAGMHNVKQGLEPFLFSQFRTAKAVPGRLQFSASENPITTAHVAIFDSQGNKVLSERMVDPTLKLAVDHLKNGTYYLNVTRDGKSYQKQIVIQH